MTDALREWIQSFNSGIKWLNKLNLDSTTKDTYLPNLKKYCEWINKNPDELIQLKLEGMSAPNTPIEFQAEDLLEKFISTSDFTVAVKDSIRTTVLSFYKKNRRALEEVMDVATPESKHRCPKTQDIIELENAFTFLRDKALLWFIASAPFRVETITKLKWKDLKPTNDIDLPYSLLIEGKRLKGSGTGKYRGVKQVAFLHRLASQKLEGYIKELERKEYKVTQDDPIFIAYRKEKKITALAAFSIEGNFRKASLRAWHDLEEKRFSPHDLRSFVQTALENAGINTNIIAPILGHKPKGVDFHYSEHELTDFLAKFKIALPYLLPQSVEKIKAETEQMKTEAERDKKRIAELEKQVEDMPTKIRQELEKMFPDLKKLYT
jgi:site-specific recombinase XerD